MSTFLFFFDDSFNCLHSVSEEEYQSIMTAFKQRADENGCISREAFIESVSSTSHPELAGMIFDVFDKDSNSVMDVCSHLKVQFSMRLLCFALLMRMFSFLYTAERVPYYVWHDPCWYC